MEPPVAFHARAVVTGADGRLLYAGEAIYRPAKPYPATGEPTPMLGIPDASLSERPSTDSTYLVRIRSEEIPAETVFLERVSTCWWFVLARVPTGPPYS